MDPSTGTFTSMDTYGGSLSDPMSLHKYMFANSNPLIYCDPSGHEASLQGMVAAMAISGILSAVDSGILYSLQNKESDTEKYGKTVYGWNVATAAMNGFLKGFIFGFIGYALCSILLVRLVLSAVGVCLGIQRASAGLDELESSGGNADRGLYNFLTGLLLVGVSTYGLAKSGSEFINKYGDGIESFGKADEYPYSEYKPEPYDTSKWKKSLKPTQESISGTNVPKSFVLEGKYVKENEIWVHANATKHMGEFINSANGSALVESELVLSFQETVNQIIPKVKPGRNFFQNVNGWEIGINGDTGVIYHAVYRG